MSLDPTIRGWGALTANAPPLPNASPALTHVDAKHTYQAKQRELDERCSDLATSISLTQQEQIETCLLYRLFAVGQLHQRYRRLRLFFAQLGCRVASRAAQVTNLCGSTEDAEARIRILGACLMLEVVEEACLRWTAVQNERQLVEGMNREVCYRRAVVGPRLPPLDMGCVEGLKGRTLSLHILLPPPPCIM